MQNLNVAFELEIVAYGAARYLDVTLFWVSLHVEGSRLTYLFTEALVMLVCTYIWRSCGRYRI